MASILLEIWQGFRVLPTWVQFWIGLVLVPVNLAAAFFWQSPSGVLIAVLAVGGMTPNLFLMFIQRGFGKAMAISHLILWIPLLFIIAPKMGSGSTFATYLMILFIVDAISICFDVKDSWEWFKGDRGVPGRK
jgi:hypothetical protein